MAAARVREQISVAPSRRFEAVLGKGCRAYREGLDVLAAGMSLAMADNADAFTPGQWELLARVLRYSVLDPDNARPGEQIAGLVELEGRTEGWVGAGAAVPDKARALDYWHAWAVMYAVRRRWAQPVAECSWWRPRPDSDNLPKEV